MVGLFVVHNCRLISDSHNKNTYTFEPTENPDTVIYVEIDQDGNRVSEVPVDLTLSATRNPSEAFNRQRSEQSLGRLQTAIGLGLSLIPSYRLARMGITAAANALKPILAKNTTTNNKTERYTNRAGLRSQTYKSKPNHWSY